MIYFKKWWDWETILSIQFGGEVDVLLHCAGVFFFSIRSQYYLVIKHIHFTMSRSNKICIVGFEYMYLRE